MLVSTEPSGLGNRLKSLWSVLRLDPDARVYWRTDHIRSPGITGTVKVPPYGELFKNDISIPTLQDCVTLESWRLIIQGLCSHSVDHLYNETPPNVIDAFLPVVAKTAPSDQIMERVGRQNVQSLNGIHVRAWVDDYYRASYLDMDQIMTRIRNLRPCFLATDSEKLREVFAGDSEVFMLPVQQKLVVADWDLALVEMLLLGRTKRMYLSKGSTFSEAAWWFAGCPKVEFITDKVYIK